MEFKGACTSGKQITAWADDGCSDTEVVKGMSLVLSGIQVKEGGLTYNMLIRFYSASYPLPQKKYINKMMRKKVYEMME